ncbi:MAG TPA: alpha/beta hydrolase [Aquabacterium sp.]|uniref:alpha/beta fold hydrolase n=1 Tax=Aquabacterium sp. TaxID=1872578 RepID=UPI002E37F72D|nr:alpha/beta hydrolase [Aquabacterium sp.]HEX5355476.1 alpha/beta hydrolase [Aquabacterium sp.]
MSSSQAYVPIYNAVSTFVTVRGLKHHVLTWGDTTRVTPEQPLLVMVHGWMDTAASFQFMVDALRQQPGWADRPIVAIDWRGFGLTEVPQTDSYFFADYLGDLDLLLDQLAPGQKIDLLGHSMGGNVVMLYAGVRSERIRKLVNLEGFGMPATQPQEAPDRYIKWLDELKQPVHLKDYASLPEVARRLQANNPRLREPFALWLAGHWARQLGDRWVINADAAHKRPQPILYRVEEVCAFLQRIACPVLFVEGTETLYFMLFNGKFSREEFLARVKLVPDFRLESIQNAGHMLHHDQPEELAVHIANFLKAADPAIA